MKSSHWELRVRVGGRNEPGARLGAGRHPAARGAPSRSGARRAAAPPSAIPPVLLPPSPRAAGTTLSPSTNASAAQTPPGVPGKSEGAPSAPTARRCTGTARGSRAEPASPRDTDHEPTQNNRSLQSQRTKRA